MEYSGQCAGRRKPDDVRRRTGHEVAADEVEDHELSGIAAQIDDQGLRIPEFFHNPGAVRFGVVNPRHVTYAVGNHAYVGGVEHALRDVGAPIHDTARRNPFRQPPAVAHQLHGGRIPVGTDHTHGRHVVAVLGVGCGFETGKPVVRAFPSAAVDREDFVALAQRAVGDYEDPVFGVAHLRRNGVVTEHIVSDQG